EKVGDAEPVCVEAELPFGLPQGWEWARLGSIAYVAAGSTPPKSAFVEEGIPYYKMYNLRNNRIDFGFQPQYITEEYHRGRLSKSIILPGDLIMNIVGPPLGKLAIAPDDYEEANTNQAAVVIRPHGRIVLAEWIRYHLMEMSEINRITTRGSAGQVNISLTQSKLIRIPVPPLAEQRRIVAALDELLGLVDEVERSQAELSSLLDQARAKVLDLAIRGRLVPQDPGDEPASELLARVREERRAMVADGRLRPRDVEGDSSIFRGEDNSYYEKVGDAEPVCVEAELPFGLPQGWEWARIPSLFVIDPRSKRLDDEFVSFAPMSAIDPGFTSSASYEIRRWRDVKKGFTHFEEGDVAFAKISPCLENRKSFVASGLVNKAGAGTTELIVLRCVGGVSPWYTLCFLKSSTFIDAAKETFMGTVGQQRVKRDFIGSVLFPVPPASEQTRIAGRVAELLGSIGL
ncbi:MAG: restriction endonuclease subunit S, partial [Eggerthellaceae bacterium]|nr:restriction endonuclease subunit S [Eggerthellaceae bacterium]